MAIHNPVLFAIGLILLIVAGYKWVFDNAPEGHEDEDGFHKD